MATSAHARKRDSFTIPFESLRNLTTVSDKENGRRIFAGQMPAKSVLDLPTDENVREYLVDPEGKKRKAKTQVHRAIRETLDNNPADFGLLNSGIVIVARDVEVDEKNKQVTLDKPSIVNGSQTQGVLREFFSDLDEAGINPQPVYVTYQLLVLDDDSLIAEVSIARNFQNDVKPLSIVGQRGHLDELEKALNKKMPSVMLRKSETDYNGIPTEKLLQVLTALIPEELWVRVKPKEEGGPNKVYTYSMKAKCLKEFDDIYIKAHNKGEEQALYKEIYQFYLDMAADAWRIYNTWKQHQGFQGSGIKNAVTRDEDGRTIKEIQDGMVFPIIAALSAFAIKTSNGWEIRPPATFDEKRLISAAIRAYQQIAFSNPWNMGKSRPCYTQCYEVTTIYRDIARSA